MDDIRNVEGFVDESYIQFVNPECGPNCVGCAFQLVYAIIPFNRTATVQNNTGHFNHLPIMAEPIRRYPMFPEPSSRAFVTVGMQGGLSPPLYLPPPYLRQNHVSAAQFPDRNHFHSSNHANASPTRRRWRAQNNPIWPNRHNDRPPLYSRLTVIPELNDPRPIPHWSGLSTSRNNRPLGNTATLPTLQPLYGGDHLNVPMARNTQPTSPIHPIATNPFGATGGASNPLLQPGRQINVGRNRPLRYPVRPNNARAQSPNAPMADIYPMVNHSTYWPNVNPLPPMPMQQESQQESQQELPQESEVQLVEDSEDEQDDEQDDEQEQEAEENEEQEQEAEENEEPVEQDGENSEVCEEIVRRPDSDNASTISSQDRNSAEPVDHAYAYQPPQIQRGIQVTIRKINQTQDSININFPLSSVSPDPDSLYIDTAPRVEQSPSMMQNIQQWLGKVGNTEAFEYPRYGEGSISSTANSESQATRTSLYLAAEAIGYNVNQSEQADLALKNQLNLKLNLLHEANPKQQNNRQNMDNLNTSVIEISEEETSDVESIATAGVDLTNSGEVAGTIEEINENAKEVEEVNKNNMKTDITKSRFLSGENFNGGTANFTDYYREDGFNSLLGGFNFVDPADDVPTTDSYGQRWPN